APPQMNTPTPSASPTAFGAPATARPPVQTMKVRFVPEERTMKLLAKKNLVFVLYAEPTETETPSPSPSAKASAAAGASAAASVTPSATPASSASPAPSPTGS